MFPVTKASHNQSLPVYPMDELLKARSEFRYRWRRRMTENPLARLIITDHYRYPPNIILKNWEKYPFDETGDESDKRQFLSTMSDKMRNRIIMLKSQPYIPSEIYDNMISEEDFQHVCSLLSNEVCITENYFQSISQNQCISACYFICDNCDFLGTNEDAVEHLKQTGHSTCSKYTPIYYVDESGATKPCELKEPRVIFYSPDRIYGWSIGDSVICCPTCKLTFPDKLMCAYHHELQHPQGEPLYTYGKVLIVKDLKIHHSLICSNCQIGFSTIEGFTQHCIDSTRCDSSFFSSLFHCQTSLPSSQSVIILSVLCKFCERSFSTVLTPEAWFTAQSTTGSSRKRKHPPPEQQQEEEEWNTENYSKTDYQSSSSVSCGKDFSRFCLSHAFQHIDRENLQSCHLSLRVIDISKSVECRLPPIHGISHSTTTVLLFSLYECKRLVLYLKKYYGGSFYLLKDAEKHLKDLLAQAALILSPYFLYNNIFS
ncbi:unnamed protein product [Trichobilharzia szidati]|nr:unnamed protein product [Trichobilharzia szidati]CAH8834648.1 unnamed protein product [Trichobilharzia szidati]